VLIYYLLAVTLLIVLVARLRRTPVERCPECGEARQDDHPICPCGWVFEYPDDGLPLEYGDPDDAVEQD